MRLAFCISSEEIPLMLDDRFGRAHGFAIAEASRAAGTGENLKIIENVHRDASGGAGTAVIQLLADEGVEGIVAPHLGPKAEEARRRFGMKLWSQNGHRTMDTALAAWATGELEDLSAAETPHGLHRA